ncbi:hypothetical protein MBLNU230_g5473t1 [Neophaeotheca triangularis]
MSTFDGVVGEFPDIRVDFFRPGGPGGRPPLAYFLSHVHSDHLTGLESCKSPLIYCSPATREILLRLEKFPHRMNFAKGILETRKQTYRHLKKLLKPIPLETPTTLELSPGRSIRVTLFDANHCVGAVMFLIEDEHNAILYTGDIRSEAWWVNAITRNPIFIPYVFSPGRTPLRRLDNVYLDTTFATKADPYRDFPSKADGITELLEKVSQYPADTIFYVDSWTFGYEDVWQALATFLRSPIHVDDYRLGLYRALFNGSEPKAPETVKMIGYHCGNHFIPGYLTDKQARIHSCEKGTGCPVFKKDFVRITPIISRHNGMDMAELGAGGGQGDLNQKHELETWDPMLVTQLLTLCAAEMHAHPEYKDVMQLLMSAVSGQRHALQLDASLFAPRDTANAANEPDHHIQQDELEDLSIDKLLPALLNVASKTKEMAEKKQDNKAVQSKAQLPQRADGLPQQVTFPYSRHASYSELCHLVDAFKPKNIHPCTVDGANWTPAASMEFLFADIYGSNQSFTHDQMMLHRYNAKPAQAQRSRSSSPSDASDEEGEGRHKKKRRTSHHEPLQDHGSSAEADGPVRQDPMIGPTESHRPHVSEVNFASREPFAEGQNHPSPPPMEQLAVPASQPISNPLAGWRQQPSDRERQQRQTIPQSDREVIVINSDTPSPVVCRTRNVEMESFEYGARDHATTQVRADILG